MGDWVPTRVGVRLLENKIKFSLYKGPLFPYGEAFFSLWGGGAWVFFLQVEAFFIIWVFMFHICVLFFYVGGLFLLMGGLLGLAPPPPCQHFYWRPCMHLCTTVLDTICNAGEIPGFLCDRTSHCPYQFQMCHHSYTHSSISISVFLQEELQTLRHQVQDLQHSRQGAPPTALHQSNTLATPAGMCLLV